jgi:hypothetical protein
MSLLHSPEAGSPITRTDSSHSTDAAPCPVGPAPKRMSFEEKMLVADTIVKGVGALLLIVGGWVSVAKYLEDARAGRENAQRQQEADLEQRKKEFKIKFYEQQFALYSAICDATAKMATADHLEDVKEELRTFNTLYWGKLCIVESKAVEFMQRKIHDELAKIERLDIEPPSELKYLCYQLAHACREDLEEVFKTKIGSLPPERKGPSLSPELLKQSAPAKKGKIAGSN